MSFCMIFCLKIVVIYRKEVMVMAIVKKEAYYNSSTGVNKIRALIWLDDEVEHVGVFQIAHGVSEHIDRYDHFFSRRFRFHCRG